MGLDRPISSQPHYGEHLGDAGYWSPWVVEVLRRHDLPVVAVEPPFVGSFPTFLCGDVVVKLFGKGFDGGESAAAELAMHRLLATQPRIPAPGLVAAGSLFDDGDGWAWPYLVTERVEGVAVRDATAGRAALETAAHQLGEAAAVLHALVAPSEVAARDLVPRLRAETPERLARFGLPEHLLAQAPAFLADAPDERGLVHADLTADHLFVDGKGLTSIIDWGDAIVADPTYELVAVRFDGLRCDPGLFEAFLDGYGWPDAAEFARGALQAVLTFQFDAISTIARMVDLAAVDTLDDLSRVLFDRAPSP